MTGARVHVACVALQGCTRYHGIHGGICPRCGGMTLGQAGCWVLGAPCIDLGGSCMQLMGCLDATPYYPCTQSSLPHPQTHHHTQHPHCNHPTHPNRPNHSQPPSTAGQPPSSFPQERMRIQWRGGPSGWVPPTSPMWSTLLDGLLEPVAEDRLSADEALAVLRWVCMVDSADPRTPEVRLQSLRSLKKLRLHPLCTPHCMGS